MNLVISFSVKQVREFLLKTGMVYTWRKNKRKKTGKDWANSGRGTKKIADVFITEIGFRKPLYLRPFVDRSSFSDIDIWQNAIVSLNEKVSITSNGWLYKVEVINKEKLRTDEED